MGVGDSLVVRCSDDLKFFKRVTEGKFIMMGTATAESLPFKLPNRYSVAVSRTPSKYKSLEKVDEVLPFDLEMIESTADAYYAGIEDTVGMPNSIYVIGGPTLIKSILHEFDTLIVTEFDFTVGPVDNGVKLDSGTVDIIRTDYIKTVIEEKKVEVTTFKGKKITTNMRIVSLQRKNH